MREDVHNSDFQTVVKQCQQRLQGLAIDAKAMEDMTKAFSLLVYVNANLETIENAVNDKWNIQYYRFREDMNKGVLRDPDGTAFHINGYPSGTEARRSLADFVDQIAQLIPALLQKTDADVIEFVQAFRYDDQVGCMEARFAEPLKVATRLVLGTEQTLHQFMQARAADCVARQLQANAKNLLNVSFPYLGCELVLDEPGQSRSIVMLGINDILQYFAETMDDPLPVNTVFAVLFQQAQKHQAGYSGMVQLDFASESMAQAFVAWCKAQELVQEHGIDKARVSQEKNLFRVRLSPRQYQLLSGKVYGEAQHSVPAVNVSNVPIVTIAAASDDEVSSQGDHNRMREAFFQKLATVQYVQIKDGHIMLFFSSKIDAECYQNLFPASVVTEARWLIFIKYPAVVIAKEQLAFLDRSLSIQSIKQRIVDNIYQVNSKINGAPSYGKIHLSNMKILSEQQVKSLASALDGGILGAALIIHNEDGRTALHVAACIQSAEAFMCLVNKASAEVISAALSIQSNDGWTALHVAARNQSAEAFMCLVNNASAEAISASLIIQSEVGWTALQLAAQHQSAEAFMCLLNKASPEALNRAVVLMSKTNMSFAQIVFAYQPPEVISTLVARLSAEALVNMLALKGKSHFLGNVSGWHLLLTTQPTAVIEQVLAKLHAVNPADSYLLNSLIQDFLREGTDQDKCHLRKSLARHYSGILCQKVKLLLLPCQDQFAEQQHELESKRALSGSAQIKPAKELLQQHSLLAKVIKQEHWLEFARQLGDYQYRPALRANKQASHKYIHANSEIIDYQKKSNKQAKRYDSTKKSASTLLSSDISTRVFGIHDRKRPLAGLLFDFSQCEVKAMLAQDYHTYSKKWIGDKDEVRLYRNEVSAFSFFSRQSFRQAITGRVIHNEVLAKYKREAVVAVFCSKDDSASLDLAQQYQKELSGLGVSVPIVGYDAFLRVFYLIKESYDSVDSASVKQPDDGASLFFSPS